MKAYLIISEALHPFVVLAGDINSASKKAIEVHAKRGWSRKEVQKVELVGEVLE